MIILRIPMEISPDDATTWLRLGDQAPGSGATLVWSEKGWRRGRARFMSGR